MLEIKAFIDMSLVDWDGKLSSVLFLPRCNFRCPFCYNSGLVLHPESIETISSERVEDHLRKQRGWIDGVCITGGEPLLHRESLDLCSRLKKMGFLVKVDTNGTNPKLMKEMIEEGLIDYVALDIKAPLTEKKYSEAIGINAKKFLGRVKETIAILLESRTDYEFRTTVVPTLHEEEDIEEICVAIKGCRRYALQRFDVGLGKKTIDPDFGKLKPFTLEEMERFLTIASEFLPSVKLR